jgi:adenylate cyclase
MMYKNEREYEKSVAHGKRAVELDPNGAEANLWYGGALLFASRPKEAIPQFQKVLRLNPNASTWALIFLGHALRNAGRPEEAVSAYKKALKRAPDHLVGHIALVVTYTVMGREEEARAEAQEVLRINPKFSLSKWKKRALNFKDPAENDMIINAMNKALKSLK